MMVQIKKTETVKRNGYQKQINLHYVISLKIERMPKLSKKMHFTANLDAFQQN